MPLMLRHIASVVAPLLAATLLPAAAAPSLGPDASAACARLVGTIPASAIGVPSGEALIDTAVLTPASPMVIAEKAATPASRITPALPEFCKVLGHIDPVDPDAPPIKFQINLPSNWNGRSVQYGGGGFNGVLISGLGLVPAGLFDQPAPLALGYLTYGTDSGHQNTPDAPVQAFAANDEAFVNFAHAAYKKVRDVAVATSQRAYGKAPEKLYFMGSSEGGREALTMAQRYPNDFDGIFARVPVISWTGLQHGGWRAGVATMGGGWINPEQVKMVGAAVLAACDAQDGASDGLVANPVACRAQFDPASLACKPGQSGDTCLSVPQLAALQALYSPFKFPFALANGVTQYPGFGVSGEATPAFGPTGGWGAWFTGASAPTQPAAPSNGIAWVYGSGGIRHIFARDPNLDVTRYRPEEHAPRILEVSALMDSTNPDLSAFAARGGKLIMLENMADYAQSPYAGIGYFETVQAKMGREKVAGFLKLYTAPGVDHVGNGAPGNVDMLGALVDWVEEGRAPSGLIAMQYKMEPSLPLARSLPLCEWPQWPRYSGGDVTQAKSFSCGR